MPYDDDDMVSCVDQAVALARITVACTDYMQKYNISLGEMMQSINHVLLRDIKNR